MNKAKVADLFVIVFSFSLNPEDLLAIFDVRGSWRDGNVIEGFGAKDGRRGGEKTTVQTETGRAAVPRFLALGPPPAT